MAAPDEDEPFPVVRTPSEVWAHVEPRFVVVSPLDGALAMEIGLAVAWEPEHTLGVHLQNGALVELCGSTVPR